MQAIKHNQVFLAAQAIDDYILISIAPVNGEDIVIKNFKERFKDKKFKWITYLSATSVYGDHRGEWVDETSQTNPTS